MRGPSPRAMVRWMRLWPPFLGAGIRVVRTAEDFLAIEVELRRTWFNRNAVGTHFGGSLYAMADPWYMLMLMQSLGRGYEVWDKSAQVRYVRPGLGTVRAEFSILPDAVADIRRRADAGEVVEPVFTAEVKDPAGNTVTIIEKTLHVRRRRTRDEEPAP